MNTDLAVVVVNWNTRDLLRRCLGSVQEGLDGAPFSWRIVVVDGASGDGSAAMVWEEFPGATLLELPENRGFGAAANYGLQALSPSPRLPVPQPSSFSEAGDGERARWGERPSPRYLLLLNADTEIVGRAIPVMVGYMAEHADVGVIGPQLRYPDGTVQSSRRRFPTPGTLFWESTVLEQYWPGNPWARRYHLADRPDDVEQEVDWLVGAALLLRAEAIAQAGLLDEGYFLYFEELDWCRRIRRAGWRIVYLPAAQVVHHEGRSTEQVPLQRHLHFGRSKVRYARQAFGNGWAGAVRWFLRAMYAGQWLIEGSKWLLGHRRALRRERMGIYAALLRDGLGEAREAGRKE